MAGAISIKVVKAKLSSAEYHNKAAQCHYEAANHHFDAAKNHEAGNHKEASEYALKAYWYHCLACETEKDEIKHKP